MDILYLKAIKRFSGDRTHSYKTIKKLFMYKIKKSAAYFAEHFLFYAFS